MSTFESKNDWTYQKYSTSKYVFYIAGLYSLVESVELPITQLQDIIGKKIRLKATIDGAVHTYDESNNTITGYNKNKDFVDAGNNTYYLDITISIAGIPINYKDAGGGEFSGTHTSGYSTNHTNGETTTLDTPTKPYYTFAGWYLNDPTCAESNKITSLSADKEYETITLYAKWTPNVVTITLNCTNYSSAKPNYMIYLYKNDDIVSQIVPTGQQAKFEIYGEDFETGNIEIAFVYGYYGRLTVTSQDGITINNRKITITSTTDKTISYTLYTPLINSSILI